jgi:hypothetical protein
MGYITNFTLTVTPDPSEELNDELTGDKNSGSYIGYFDQYMNGYYLSGKWYDHTEDMIALSLRYPEYVFQLEGDGEETGDHWVMYFRNGQYYTVQLSVQIPLFDPSKLG